MIKRFLFVTLLFIATAGYAQNEAPSTLSSDYLSGLTFYDPSSSSAEITYLVDEVSFYDENQKLIPIDRVGEFRLNADYTIDKMYIDNQKFVKVVTYRKSTPAEKEAKEEQLRQLANKDPNDYRGTYPKPFSLTDISGNVYTPASLRGKVVVINFWFVGCAPCEQEMPVLNQLVEKYQGKEVVFLGLTFDNKEKVEQFLTKKDFDFNIVPEATQMIADYNIVGYPTHMLIDKKLVIQYLGPLPEALIKDKLIEAIEMLLVN